MQQLSNVNKVEVGYRIYKIRKALNLSQSKFGSLFNASKGTVSNWEGGNHLPSLVRLEKIAAVGQTTLNQLLYGREESPPPVLKPAEKKLINSISLDQFIKLNNAINYKGNSINNLDKLEALLDSFFAIKKEA